MTVLKISGHDIAVENFSDEFLLLRAAGESNVDLPVLGSVIFERRFEFVSEVIAAEAEICLKLNGSFSQQDLDELCGLQETRPTSDAAQIRYSLPVWFSEAADWDLVCQHTGLNRSDYLQQLVAQDLQVAMFGFLPGFVYLKGLASRLQVPRKANPDRSTDANSFAVGGTYAGIYSLPSPAGWNVLGRSAVPVMQTDQLPPVILQPGDSIRIQPVDQNEYDHLMRERPTLVEYNG